MVYQQYTWLLGLTVPVALISAFGIGANDVANSFASSVGSKAITMGQAICIAAVCEFLGAVLLGASVTDTVKNSIAKTSAYKTTPALLMYVMFSALCSSAIWDNLTCHLELPVSTTHTIVGSIAGASIATFGFDSVLWSAKQANFPYIKGMTPVFLSWVCSPICAAIVVAILYTFVRTFILRSQNSFRRATFAVPVLVGLTLWIFVLFIIQTGNKNNTWEEDFVLGKAMGVSLGIGAFFALVTGLLIIPSLTKKIDRDHARLEAAKGPNGAHKLDVNMTPEQLKAAALEQSSDEELGKGANGLERAGSKAVKAGLIENELQDDQPGRFTSAMSGVYHKSGLAWMHQKAQNNPVGRTIFYGANYDVHDVTNVDHKDYDKEVVAIWENAEVFDWRTERLFRYIQVFSACAMSLAHGANDVANAMGPFAAVYNIWESRSIPSRSNVPTWILVIGGVGIVLGLATYGYKIMRVLGVKAVKLTNARGFCVELSTAIVVMVASYTGLPVSTTQTVTGAIIAMGCFDGLKGVNWKVTIRMALGWILTIVLTALFTAGTTSLALYAPSKPQSLDSVYTAQAFYNSTRAMIYEMNVTNGLPGSPTYNADFANQLSLLSASVRQFSNETIPLPKRNVPLFQQTLNLYNTSSNLIAG